MKLSRRLKVLCTFLAGSFLNGAALSQDNVPKLINYQGKLTDAAGGALTGGNYSVRFELFDDTSAGTLIWGETRQVTVVNGLFNVALGGGGASPVAGAAVNDIGFAFSSSRRFLQTTIVTGPGISASQTLSPRQQMASVPFALEAQQAGRADVAVLAESLIPKLTLALNPPGTIIVYAGAVTDNGSLSEPVPGYLLCNGAVIDATVADGKYAALRAVLKNAWGHGGNAANENLANLPDLRGVFLRGWSGSASDGYVDPDGANRVARLAGGNPGNTVGSFQMDVLQNITGEIGNAETNHYTGAFAYGGRVPSQTTHGDGETDRYGTFDASRVARTSTETRGKNANVVYLIKY